MSELWNGFYFEEFIFEDRQARIVFPTDGNGNGRLALKTVYWDAFPEAVEIDLLKLGFHLCFVENNNRWGTDEDLDREYRFVHFVTQKYGLQKRVVPIGMSCGGLMAVKLAAKYPEIISCLYLDAPVINYLSCPGCVGDAKPEDVNIPMEEIYGALGLESMSQLIAYRDMPLDKIPVLLKNKIPVVLVAGLADRVVPYHENGAYLEKAYQNTNLDLAVFLKPECDHHPHGLTDNREVIQFILSH